MDQTMAPPARPVQRRPVTELLKVPPLRRIMVVNTIFSGAWDTHLCVVPLYGVAVGLTATTIGAILASFAVGTFVIRLLLPFIEHRVLAWALVRAGRAASGASFGS